MQSPRGPFSGVSPEPLKVLFSPQVEDVGGGGGVGPLPTATHARIVVSKIKLTSARGKKVSFVLLFFPLPSLAIKGKKPIFLEVVGGRQKGKKIAMQRDSFH